jgi:hypothetical protein
MHDTSNIVASFLHHHQHQNQNHAIQYTNNKSLPNKIEKIKLIKKNLEYIKQQTNLNNELNRKTRVVLTNLNNINEKLNKQEIVKKKSNENFNNNNNNISKINSDLIKYVKLRERYIKHANYWQQIWLFTDNPIFEYGTRLISLSILLSFFFMF